MKTYNVLLTLVHAIEGFYAKHPNWYNETPEVDEEVHERYREALYNAQQHLQKGPDSTLSKVAEFHRTFDHPILQEPSIPHATRVALRLNLLTEELKELEKALSDGDLVEVADALCDLQYVLDGAKLEFGFKDKFEELFNEVHRSNMSKVCATEQEADETIGLYTDLYAKVQRNGVWFVYRREDGKTIKNIHYSPANLKDLL